MERLVNSMMMHGRNNGKKLMTVTIVKHAFEIIHLLTSEVSVQQLSNNFRTVLMFFAVTCTPTRCFYHLMSKF